MSAVGCMGGLSREIPAAEEVLDRGRGDLAFGGGLAERGAEGREDEARDAATALEEEREAVVTEAIAGGLTEVVEDERGGLLPGEPGELLAAHDAPPEGRHRLEFLAQRWQAG